MKLTIYFILCCCLLILCARL